MKWTNAAGVISIASLLLIAACGTLETSPTLTTNTSSQNPNSPKLVIVNPNIPFDAEEAFFPLHPSGEGVFYSWRECERRILVCTKWRYKEVIFRFNDSNIMEWFINNDFGFKKRERP